MIGYGKSGMIGYDEIENQTSWKRRKLDVFKTS